MARSNEPLWWAPFMAGAGISAMFMPAMLFVTGIAVGLGWISEEHLHNLLGYRIVQLFLVVVICLSLFHAAHRLRFVLTDLMTAKGGLAFLCYGTAVVGTILAILVVVHIWP